LTSDDARTAHEVNIKHDEGKNMSCSQGIAEKRGKVQPENMKHATDVNIRPFKDHAGHTQDKVDAIIPVEFRNGI